MNNCPQEIEKLKDEIALLKAEHIEIAKSVIKIYQSLVEITHQLAKEAKQREDLILTNWARKRSNNQ
jgi:hypothetical protein